MTLESTNIQLYTGTQPALANNRHTLTKLGLAFSDMISGKIPIGIGEREFGAEMLDGTKSEMVSK